MTMRGNTIGRMVAVAMLCVACGGGSGGNEVPTIVESGMVEANVGARVVSADGALTLTITPGALSEDTVISIVPLSAGELSAGWDPAGNVVVPFRFEPDGLEFQHPVLVELDVPEADVSGGSYWTFATVDSSGALEVMPTLQVAAAVGRAAFRSGLIHFSEGGVIDVQLRTAFSTSCDTCSVNDEFIHSGTATLTNDSWLSLYVRSIRFEYPAPVEADVPWRPSLREVYRYLAPDGGLFVPNGSQSDLDFTFRCRAEGESDLLFSWSLASGPDVAHEDWVDLIYNDSWLASSHTVACVEGASGPSPDFPYALDAQAPGVVTDSVVVTVTVPSNQLWFAGGELCVAGTAGTDCGLTQMTGVNPNDGTAMPTLSPPAGNAAGTVYELVVRVGDGSQTNKVRLLPGGNGFYVGHEFTVDPVTFEETYTGVVYPTTIPVVIVTQQ